MKASNDSGIVKVLASAAGQALQNKFAPVNAAPPGTSMPQLDQPLPAGLTRVAVLKGTIAGLFSGLSAAKRQRGNRKSWSPFLIVAGYVLGGIATALLYQKLNPNSAVIQRS